MKANWVAALSIALASAPAQAQTCEGMDRVNASQAIERIVSWDQLYKAFQEHRKCDVEAVGELFTDALLRLIVEWKNVKGLAEPMERDKDYRSFIVKHLHDPLAKDDLLSIYARAQKECPRGMEAFCKEIGDVVKPGQAPATELAPMPTITLPPAQPK